VSPPAGEPTTGGTGDRAPRADIGVFGGSGLYSLLDDVDEVTLDTPFGPPAAPVTIGTVGDRRVAFLPRHGRDHNLPPHRVPYRANAWALRELGVRAMFGPCASGSLQPGIHPGDFVVLDQIVDRTMGRASTFHDGPDAPDGLAAVDHVSFADPYDAELRKVAIEACRAEGVTVHESGTVVVMEGPRFSTRAESRWYAAQGWHVINMTQMPEAVLATEAGIPYAAIALITDYDVGLDGVEGIEPVTMDEVFATLARNADVVRRVLFRAVGLLPDHVLAAPDPPA
jgi:5'-methylthioadenosine phosphorylase